MIIGSILLEGRPFSIHRFPESGYSIARVKELLELTVMEEELASLGTIEVRVHQPTGLERLMAVILGRDDD